MKTLTEFDAFRLKNAMNTKKELTAAGKTAEELPAAMGEALKLEGDKLTLFLAALEVAEERPEGLKRVVVFAVEEGKSAPKGALLKGDKNFLAEFFAPPQSAQKRFDSRDGGGRDGKRGGKGKGGGKGRGGRNEGGGRGPRPERAAPVNVPHNPLKVDIFVKPGASTAKPGEEPAKHSRPPRKRRPPHPPLNTGPVDPATLPKPLAKPIETAPKAAAEKKPDSSESSGSEAPPQA
ncbi:MAG: hypothetical protein HY074_15495 [Deltaproteobacteria bacterium]|nr:hypothetical protein [Deltaproteobacteria bacterium]